MIPPLGIERARNDDANWIRFSIPDDHSLFREVSPHWPIPARHVAGCSGLERSENPTRKREAAAAVPARTVENRYLIQSMMLMLKTAGAICSEQTEAATCDPADDSRRRGPGDGPPNSCHN
jgi:hypothetical protein